MTFLLIAACILTGAALLDGVSTVRFLKKGFHEVDPVMVWIFGSDRPNVLTVYFRGGLVILAEIAIAFGIRYFWPPAGIVFGFGGFVQAVLHVRAAILNFKLD